MNWAFFMRDTTGIHSIQFQCSSGALYQFPRASENIEQFFYIFCLEHIHIGQENQNTICYLQRSIFDCKNCSGCNNCVTSGYISGIPSYSMSNYKMCSNLEILPQFRFYSYFLFYLRSSKHVFTTITL